MLSQTARVSCGLSMDATGALRVIATGSIRRPAPPHRIPNGVIDEHGVSGFGGGLDQLVELAESLRRVTGSLDGSDPPPAGAGPCRTAGLRWAAGDGCIDG
jgi:hypothetical protein